MFKLALGEDSTFAMAAYYLGVSSADLGDRFTYLRRALALSDRASVRDRLYIRSGWGFAVSDPSFLAVAETLSIRFPNEVDGHYWRAQALTRDRRYLEAIPVFERVTRDGLAGCASRRPAVCRLRCLQRPHLRVPRARLTAGVGTGAPAVECRTADGDGAVRRAQHHPGPSGKDRWRGAGDEGCRGARTERAEPRRYRWSLLLLVGELRRRRLVPAGQCRFGHGGGSRRPLVLVRHLPAGPGAPSRGARGRGEGAGGAAARRRPGLRRGADAPAAQGADARRDGSLRRGGSGVRYRRDAHRPAGHRPQPRRAPRSRCSPWRRPLAARPATPPRSATTADLIATRTSRPGAGAKPHLWQLPARPAGAGSRRPGIGGAVLQRRTLLAHSRAHIRGHRAGARAARLRQAAGRRGGAAADPARLSQRRRALRHAHADSRGTGPRLGGGWQCRQCTGALGAGGRGIEARGPSDGVARCSTRGNARPPSAELLTSNSPVPSRSPAP